MNKTAKILIAIIIILLLVAAYFMVRIYQLQNTTTSVNSRIDTVEVVRIKEKIVLDSARAKIVFRTIYKHVKENAFEELDNYSEKSSTDSLNNIPAFTASLDTIVKKDTINVSYYYPENYFKLLIKQAPDTLKTIKIFNDKIITQKSLWWETAAYVAGGFLIGYIIAK